MRVHPVFHVNNLKLYQPDHEDQARNQPVREHVDIRPPKPKEVEEILAERVTRVSRRPCQQFLVKWKGLGDEETSWENVEDLKKKFQQKIQDFKAKAVGAPEEEVPAEDSRLQGQSSRRERRQLKWGRMDV
ncbi:uncharacterized protein LOC112192511 [Rosa chinensis]|uniref:uncharacterized protein LOC112192511 n=1 Tax=Rosa chinensis TaxID=74649 RepID=UPI000D0917AE|nr:uncharacterized protein LOC112192511 [Rosa chinensis]